MLRNVLPSSRRRASLAAPARRWARRATAGADVGAGADAGAGAGTGMDATRGMPTIDGGAPDGSVPTTEATLPTALAGFEALLHQMQQHGGFTIIARGSSWAHVYRATISDYARAAYGGLVQHGRVTWQANGTPRFEALRLSNLLPRSSSLPTLEAVIVRLQAGYFEILQRGDDWVDIRRANPERFAQFAGIATYSWHRVHRQHDGSVTVSDIPPDGWLDIEVTRLLSEGWQRDVHTHGHGQAREQSVGSPCAATVLRRRTPFWPHPQLHPQRLTTVLLPWRLLPAALHWLRDSRPERIRLSLDGDGRVQREELHLSGTRRRPTHAATPPTLTEQH